jgi:hypothetical protein
MVNYTARVVSFVAGDDIALSNTAKEQVDEEIGTQLSSVLFVRQTTRFKGYEGQQRLWKVDPGMWWKVRDRQGLEPSDGSAESSKIRRTFQVTQADLDDLHWIGELEAETYSRADAVPPVILDAWFRANPSGFSVIVADNEERVGHIDILPLRPDALQRFMRGAIVEREIEGKHLFGESERQQVRDLYVESVILKRSAGLSGATTVMFLLSQFLSITRRICDPMQVENVYAIAASNSGEHLMRQVGFSVITPADLREDGHDFFGIQFSDLLTNLSAVFPGYS